MSTLLYDLRYGLRQLWRRPALYGFAIVTLAIGMAAGTLLFGIVDRVLLAPLPGVAEHARLVEIGRNSRNETFDTLGSLDVEALRTEIPALDRAFGYALAPINLRAQGEPTRAFGLAVGESYFETLGVTAGQGRLFGGADRDALRAAPGVVLSDGAWRRWFNADPAVIGSTIVLNGASFGVLGVAAPEFRGHIAGIAPDVYVPLVDAGLINAGWRHLADSVGSRWLLAVGRIAPGASREQLQAQLDALAARLASQRPDLKEKLVLTAAPLAPLPATARGPVSLFAGLLFVFVGLVLGIAGINVAGMLLARGEARAGEFAMRAALGASRRRVVQQLLVEGVLIAVLAAVAGVALAAWARGLLGLISLPAPVPIDFSIPLDLRLFGFAALLALAVALLVALLPALRLSARDPKTQLGSAGGMAAATRSRLRDGLVVAQIAVTLALLVSSGLLLRALSRAADIDPGIRLDGVAYADFDLQPAGYDDPRAMATAQNLLTRVRELPGVEAASLGGVLPLSLSRMGYGLLRDPAAPDKLIEPEVNPVASGWFATLGIALDGRDFADGDRAGTTDVVVINRTLARQLFGDAAPIGREVELGDGSEWRRLTIVGVSADGKYASLADHDTPFLYLPLAQWPRQSLNLMVKSNLTVAALDAGLRPLLNSTDPNLPALAVHALTDVTQLSLLPQRIAGSLASALAALGLLLAGSGLYGVLALQVTQRQREIGVRVALGASRSAVVQTVARRAARLSLVGIGIGLVLSTLLGLALADLLFGVGALDPPTVLAALLLTVLMVAAAAVGPALRALAVAPSVALRGD